MPQQPAMLYVEDDPLSREIMAMMLIGLGYTQLTLFEDSADFLPRLETLTPAPDLFFLDIHLTPYDGFDMLGMLRGHPRFCSKKVIAVTASVMNEEIARLKEVGFNGAIGKPLDFDNFAGLIERVLKGEKVWYVI